MKILLKQTVRQTTQTYISMGKNYAKEVTPFDNKCMLIKNSIVFRTHSSLLSDFTSITVVWVVDIFLTEFEYIIY